MPLNKSGSKAAFKQNIKTEVAAGKPVKQAVAIAYASQPKHVRKIVGGKVQGESPHRSGKTTY
jgi:hypothetical protein